MFMYANIFIYILYLFVTISLFFDLFAVALLCIMHHLMPRLIAIATYLLFLCFVYTKNNIAFAFIILIYFRA